MTVPQTLSLGLHQQIDERWALLASLGWQDWSEFGEVGVEVDTSADSAQSRTIDANYQDTWHLSLGAQYQATPKLLWNAGIAYDSSAVSDSDRTVMLPMDASWRLGTGATYRLDRNTDLNLSWDLIWFGDMPVDQTKPLSGERLSGEYRNAWIQTLAGNMTWRF
ncbi:47 kDa outer membrane protein precursor [compost metagenome]